MSGEHRRRYKLGCGVVVEFTFWPDRCPPGGELNMTALACEWDPAIPRFTSNNARNKFERQYRAARDDFMQDVAQLLGGSILNVDIGERGRLVGLIEFKPQVPS